MSLQSAAKHRLQKGSVQGDSAYTSPDQIAQRLSAIRRNRGLEDDSASNQIWQDRIAAGTHNLGDARTAISGKASQRAPAPQPSSPPQQQQQPPVDNFGEQPYDMGVIDNNISGGNFGQPLAQPQPSAGGGGGGNIPPPQNMQTGSVQGDEAFTTPEQLEGRAADIRANRGLPPDPASDQIWVERILSGKATLGDARTAISQKAAREYENQMSGEELPEIPEFEPSFDFNADYERGRNQISEQESRLRSFEEQQRRRMAEDAQQQTSNLDEMRERGLKANTENMADRGLVHSGININQQAEIGKEYTKNLSMIEQARARGEEDLAQHLASQFDQLNQTRSELERFRAESQAAIERERAMHEAINSTPQPTVAGRYPIEGVEITDQARQHAGYDEQHFGSVNDLAAGVEGIFNSAGVPLTQHRQSSNETDWERLARIVEDVAAGRRTLDNVRESVYGIAAQTGA